MNIGVESVYLRFVRFQDVRARNFFQIRMNRKGRMDPGVVIPFELVRDIRCGKPLPQNDDCILCFQFDGFEIVRVVNANLGSREFGVGQGFQGVGEVIRAPERPRNRQRKFVSLPRYVVPPKLRELVEGGEDVMASEDYGGILTTKLKPTNYCSMFKVLVNLQSLGDELEIQKFSLTGVKMEGKWFQGKYLFAFDVPELKDGRPSLMCYDLVSVTKTRESLGEFSFDV
jgi:hypothetical protein